MLMNDNHNHNNNVTTTTTTNNNNNNNNKGQLVDGCVDRLVDELVDLALRLGVLGRSPPRITTTITIIMISIISSSK